MIQRCAIYARYSSELQNPRSNDDQIRNCRGRAQQGGWRVLDDYVKADAEQSGSGADRPGLQWLLTAAQQRPRPFDVLLIDDTSRLSRRLADQAHIIDQLRFLCIRVIAVSQGIDTESEQAEVLMTVHGLVDSLYIKELAKKTHRGLEGCVLNGFHAGGRCYGYKTEPGPNGVRRVIEETEATVLNRMFELRACGMSYKKIATTLNAERIPPPRPRQRKRRSTWCPTAIRAMLRNELYTGTLVWNRSQFIKRPGTNKRVARPRPRSEWKVIDRPELRIVSADLWRRVQVRERQMMEVYGRAGAGINKASSSPYLLTGFLKCGLCGANLIIVAGKGKKTIRKYYGCSQHFHRGACANALKIRQDVVERNLFHELQAKVLTAPVIEYTIREFTRQIRQRASRTSEESAAMQRRKEELERELTRLTDAIAQIGHSSAMVEAITEREREFERLKEDLNATGRGRIEQFLGGIREFVTARLGDLAGLISADPHRARVELAKHTAEILMIPEPGADGQLHYVAEGGWDLLGAYDSALVAGGGFEPPTFGL